MWQSKPRNYIAPVAMAFFMAFAVAALPYLLDPTAAMDNYDPKRKKCPIGGCTPPNPVK